AFGALMKKVNPDTARAKTAQRLPGQVRDWLKDHDFETRSPHSRLIGSYGRQTATTDIKDVDTLLFLPLEALVRTPESVLRELKGVLDVYPHASAEASPQRRSIRLDFHAHALCMDIVGAVADEGIDRPLWVPDREKREWIPSDPLGYGRSLSTQNADHGDKLVPLIKLVKGWRDEQMVYQRPKSYLLEVIVFQAVTGGAVVLKGWSTAENVCAFFEHIEKKWNKLLDEGDGVPRILDPQLGNVISSRWERYQFEAFMRRAQEAAHAARAALDADSDERADTHWKKVFGALWPTPEEVEEEARTAAAAAKPGKAYITSSGRVTAAATAGAMRTRPTTFHGTEG
ncbi:MAG: nucleotidyltransferase, partial [Acidobacteria bacterium]|nr:nucleotidyltransferase [Acidobacteriota bacterium]